MNVLKGEISTLKYFNDFQNQNFSVLWLKWAKTMKIKQNQTFFHRIYLNLTPCLFYQKILRCFNNFQNQNFSVLWLRWTQTMAMKQNQIFFTGHKILKYFNDFYNCHLPISLQSKHRQVKWNKIKHVMCKTDSIFPYLQISTLFKWFLKFISW